MDLNEWLRKVGFITNPFASSQAEIDIKDAQLQEYFAEHPAYLRILDANPLRSAIIHAHRGAGKSSHRRMFEMSCAGQPPPARALIIRMLDWGDVLDRVGGIAAVDNRTYLNEIFRQGIDTLAKSDGDGLRTPDDPDLRNMLHWLCDTFKSELLPGARRRLEEYGWLKADASLDLADYNLNRYRVAEGMRHFSRIVQALGFTECYVVIDAIDESPHTINSWQAGADLLRPLIANLNMFAVPKLYLKCFVPSEIVDILLQEGTLRPDHIQCIQLAWDGQDGLQLLREVLELRLLACSDRRITSLVQLAPGFSTIDERLCIAARASPRNMLRIGERMFQLCAIKATDDALLIKPEHLIAAEQWLLEQNKTPNAIPAPVEASPPPMDPQPSPDPQDRAVGEPISLPQETPVNLAPATSIPLLRIEPGGRIWRGDEEITEWRDLTDLQRKLLDYLYEHRNRKCTKQALIFHLYNDNADDSNLRKLAQRLIAFIEPDPDSHVYIRKIRGGHLILENTID